MKIINKTKKYLHVRVTLDEYELLARSIEKRDAERQKEKQRLEYAEWFYTNHIDISWQDEYSSWHTEWKNIHTKETISQGQEPDMFVRVYKHRFRDIISKNKKKLGYKD